MNLNELKARFFDNSNYFSLSKDLANFFFNKYINNFEIAKDGAPTFMINNKFLYSKYKPCEKFNKVDLENKTKIIFLENGIGLSFFYFLNYLLIPSFQKSSFIKDLQIIIIFSSFNSFILSLFIIDYSKIILSNLFIVVYCLHIPEDRKVEISIDKFYNGNTKVNINKICLIKIKNIFQFEKFIESYFQDSFANNDDFNKFKLLLENPLNLIPLDDLNFFFPTVDIKKMVEIINEEAQKRYKSISTEKYFSVLWEKNITRNLRIIGEKNWSLENSKIDFDFSEKKGLIFWGASNKVEEVLKQLDNEDINIINKYFFSISIVSSVNLLLEKKIKIEYQVIFDAGFFGYFNTVNFSIPFILSTTIHPSILKRINKNPIFVNLQTDEERKFSILKKLPIFPFYGATLPTLYKQFQIIYNDKKPNLFLIGSSFLAKEERTHHRRYPLYRYVISKSSYLNTAMNWESIQKILNIKKFETYRNSLKRIDTLTEIDLFKEIKNIKKKLS